MISFYSRKFKVTLRTLPRLNGLFLNSSWSGSLKRFSSSVLPGAQAKCPFTAPSLRWLLLLAGTNSCSAGLVGWRVALLNTLFRWLYSFAVSISLVESYRAKGLRYSLGWVQSLVSLAERPEPCLGVTMNEFSLVSTISSPCVLWVSVSSLVWG